MLSKKGGCRWPGNPSRSDSDGEVLPSNLNRRSPYARQIEHTGRGLRLTAASKAGLPRGREANGSPVPARSGMPAPPCQWPGVADRLPMSRRSESNAQTRQKPPARARRDSESWSCQCLPALRRAIPQTGPQSRWGHCQCDPQATSTFVLLILVALPGVCRQMPVRLGLGAAGGQKFQVITKPLRLGRTQGRAGGAVSLTGSPTPHVALLWQNVRSQ